MDFKTYLNENFKRKQPDQDNETPSPEKDWKEYFDTLWDGTKIYLVVGKYVRGHYDSQFTMGGHGFVYSYIPKNEIWLEVMEDAEDITFDLLHEITEYFQMKYYGVKEYDVAHERASNVERIIRKLDDRYDPKFKKIKEFKKCNSKNSI